MIEPVMPGDGQLESIAHGVIFLEQLANQYGAERRRLRVLKVRCSVSWRVLDFMIRKGGLDVFPRLVASEHHASFSDEDLPSGNADWMTPCGGIPLGTSTLLLGSLERVNQRSPRNLPYRHLNGAFVPRCLSSMKTSALSNSRALGMPVESYMENGLLSVQRVDPAELSSGEFAAIVRRAVDGIDGGHNRQKLRSLTA